MSDLADTNKRARVTILDPAGYAITLPRLVAFLACVSPVVLWAWNHTRQLDALVVEMRAIRQELSHLQRNVPEVYDLETWRTEFAVRNPTINVPAFRMRNGG